jgi:hypothetical protein
MRRFFVMLPIVPMLCCFLVGCGGGGGNSAATPAGPSINGVLVGAYVGSTCDSAGDFGTIKLVVGSAGTVTSGTLVDFSLSSGASQTINLTGNVSGPGVISVVGTESGSSTTFTGKLIGDSSGVTAGTITQAGNNPLVIYTTISSTASTSQFAGSYIGTSEPNDFGAVSLTISPSGTLTGTANPPGNVRLSWSGKVAPDGSVNIITAGEPTVLNGGSSAFNSGGQLVMLITSSSSINNLGYVSTLTLARTN